VKLKMNAGWLRRQVILHHKLIVALLLLAILLQCVLSMRMKTMTFDEPTHLLAGYSYLKTGDFSLIWQHPPLIEVICATPLLLLQPKLPTHYQDDRSYEHDFFYESNNNADQLVFWGRIPIVFLSLLLGFTIFRWASELYGIEAGLFSLFLYSFSPNILAHSRLATNDLGLACFLFLTCYRLWKFGYHPSAGNLLLAGLTLGLALISKFTTIFLLPIYLIFPFVQLLQREAHLSAAFFKRSVPMIRYVVLIAGLGLLAILAAYPYYLKPWYRFDETILPAIQRYFPDGEIKGRAWHLVLSLRGPGREYALGLLGQLEHSKRGHDAFLWGKISSQGWWYYQPLALAIKTPVALQIMLILAICTTQQKKARLYDYFLLLAPPFLLLIAMSMASVQLGVRYALPVLPFAFVFTGRLAQAMKLEGRSALLRRPVLLSVTAVLVIWYFVSSVHIYPHYLAYFNEYVGGPPNGYKYLVDSNLDWGQDLKGLKEYMERRGIKEVNLAYFGTADPEYYGISYKSISDQDLAALREGRFTRGVFAISATFLQGLYLPGDRDRYKWFRDRDPTAQIGYSIFVYEIDCRKERMAEGTAHFTPPTIQHPLEANLGDRARFLGYDLDTASVRAGHTLNLTLYWQAQAEVDESYTVFTHLLDKDNRIWGQRDSLPIGGTLPTSCWVKGEIIVDEYDIPIQPDAPPGQYVIEIGMYQLATGQRLPIIGQEEQVVDDRVLLEEITVQ
jgi:4-amino-4-deoxy-L-arabinose transferase-like glycosyltransferase